VKRRRQNAADTEIKTKIQPKTQKEHSPFINQCFLQS